jgi:hypothetical protein
MVPLVVDRTILRLIKAVTAGRSIVSVTGLVVTETTVTGVITDVRSSDSVAGFLLLQAVADRIMNKSRLQKQ